VAASLHRELPAEGQPPTQKVSFAAYELYLQGRYYWNRRPGDVVWQALRCFEQAVALEPRFAAAWAGIADIYATLGSWENGVLEPDEAQSKASLFAARALEIDPELPEAHTTLAYTALHHERDLPAAERRFQHALALNRNYAPAHHWYSHALVAAGRFEESLEESHSALACDPMNLLLSVHLAWHHYMARKPELTLEQAERVVEMDARYHWGHYFVGWACEAMGQTARAVEAMREAVRFSGGNSVMVAGLARAYAAAGDRANALATMADLERERAGRALLGYEFALVHLALGDRQAAIEQLDRARRNRSGWMAYLARDPRLDPLRDDIRFTALAR
jgi:tetratricopeptide (TPR) repeat protein